MKILLAAGALLLGLGSSKADLNIQEGRVAEARQILLLAQAPQAEPPPDPELAPAPPIADSASGRVRGEPGGAKMRLQSVVTGPGQESRSQVQPGMVDPTTGLPVTAPIAPGSAAADPFGAGPGRAEGGGRNMRFQSVLTRLGQDGGSLVIRSGDVDPKSISTIEEDMNVMSRILEKAAEKRGVDEMRRVMGVRLSTFGDELKNMQIENYGVIFLVKVNFPLSGPPEHIAESKPNQQTNSAWEEAKREVYGQRRGVTVDEFQAVPGKPPEEQYNPKRVDELKESLVNALKNASNIRGLKEDDSVTVVVTSAATSDSFVRRMVTLQHDLLANPEVVSQKEERGVTDVARTKSTLTIKVKKGDIDAVAKGKLDADGFKKRIAISLY
ncbi:hypothetical protein [Pedosphaera parvula]|uniref:Flagellar assembly protein T N-terminal domain-containing protein n=1 Tax=Pedosphaera parvula (strain Ellin514) TaxID=320771 RepID=B9XC17_PEDPL|nr:hypothetical protein [Pedosphaera parvula]EEF62485.1 hypothetical protein Cflav_PD5120 [Pedosphaera parvula Ellin514]